MGQNQPYVNGFFDQTSNWRYFWTLSTKFRPFSKIKTTTTVLLKPFLTEQDLERLEYDHFFERVGQVLWSYLSDSMNPSFHQSAAQLLHRLHSRKLADPGSDTEDIILADLTSDDKVKALFDSRDRFLGDFGPSSEEIPKTMDSDEK